MKRIKTYSSKGLRQVQGEKIPKLKYILNNEFLKKFHILRQTHVHIF